MFGVYRRRSDAPTHLMSGGFRQRGAFVPTRQDGLRPAPQPGQIPSRADDGGPSLHDFQPGSLLAPLLAERSLMNDLGTRVAFVITLALASSTTDLGAQQPPPPCHPNPHADVDMRTVRDRDDVRKLPEDLENRLIELAGRPHSQLPTQAYAEAHEPEPPFKPKPSELFQYYLLDTTVFEPNPFTARFTGINDTAM